MTSQELYLKGNQARQQGHYAEAMNLYAQALNLDPNSPARVAREMLKEQFEFYCKDYYNP